jgi:hypothetical protein
MINAFEKKIHQLVVTIDKWTESLDSYTFDQLKVKPNDSSWSIGQVYFHLIFETNYYLSDVETCIGNIQNEKGEMTFDAKKMFRNNSFPNIRIVGDSALSAEIPQPDNVLILKENLTNLKTLLNNFDENSVKSGLIGKTKHPGLGFFSAVNWLQFADMHFRHHEKQIARIASVLNFG